MVSRSMGVGPLGGEREEETRGAEVRVEGECFPLKE